MLRFYRKMFSLLTAAERRRFLVLVPILLLVTTAEILGITAVLALLQVLADPVGALDHPWLAGLRGRLDPDAPHRIQLVLAAGVSAVVLLGLVVKASGSYAAVRFTEGRGRALATRLLAAALARPYVWSLTRNTAEIARSVLNDTAEFIELGLMPALRTLASGLTATAIIAFLVVIDPLIAIVSGGLIGGTYAAIYVWLRQRMQRVGHVVLDAQTARYRITQEATGGFKEVKLLGLEARYAARFDAAGARLARARTRDKLMREMPRLALEALTFMVLIGVVLLLLLRSGGDLAAIVPTLGIYVFATMRLLPALQQIYYSVAAMRTANAVLDRLVEDNATALAETDRPPLLAAPPAAEAAPRLPLRRSLVLDRVRFAYPAAERQALQDVSLSIEAHSSVGIVGGTGAGKTTLIDLVLGLLEPTAGAVRVDGTPLRRDTVRAWQNTVGYVPQTIYLTDDSVAGNIAFGLPPERIDRDAVERAARMAALHDFVAQDLPQGYDTIVGERGVRLSGGQRQRIGIARALYHDPDMLVFDEATSALDTITERVVMEAVQTIRRDKTILLVAHRLSTVRGCDVIHLMEHGRIVASGSFDALVAGSETFRRMATGN